MPDHKIALLREERDAARRAADRLAVLVVMLAEDAHPMYPTTAKWRGGIAGQAFTQGCSIIDPPPDAYWTQAGLPSSVARDWLEGRETVDPVALREALIEELGGRFGA